MNAAEMDLLHCYLNDALPEADIEALQSLLRENAEARRMLRDLATIDTRLTELAASAPQEVASFSPQAVTATSRKHGGIFYRRPLSGLALGLLIGVVFSSAAWAYAVPKWLEGVASTTNVVEEGFESGAAPLVTGLPTAFDRWSGDFTEVTGAQLGITPASGNKMLRILRADYEGKTNFDGSYCGDLFRLVDLRPFRQELADGLATVELSALFNAAPFPESEEYRCSIAIHALSSELAATPTALSGAVLANGSLAMARQSCPRMDRDPQSWQRVEGALKVPAETEFLLIHLGVNHIPKFQKRVAFDGHYLDDVRITLNHRR